MILDYLNYGNHGKFLTEEEKNSVRISVNNILEFVPKNSLIEHYIGWVLPSTHTDPYFHLASIISIIGARLGRKVWVIGAKEKEIYPNCYTGLLGESGGNKSTATEKDKYLNPITSTTMSALYKDFGVKLEGDTIKAKEQFKNEKVRTIYQTQFNFLPDEMGTLLANFNKEQDLLTFLTEGYGKESDFKKNTASDGLFAIINPVINILTTTAPAWINKKEHLWLWDNGFFQRFLFFSGKPHYFIAFPDKKNPQYENLFWAGIQYIDDLKPTEFLIEEEAQKYYHNWGKKFVANIPENISTFASRLVNYVLKLSLIYAVACKDTSISLQNIKLVIKLIEKIASDLTKYKTENVHDNPFSKLQQRILTSISKKPKTSIQLANNFSVSMIEIQAAIVDLQDKELIAHNMENNKPIYYIKK